MDDKQMITKFNKQARNLKELIAFVTLQQEREKWLMSLVLEAFATVRKQKVEDLRVLTHNLKLGGN